jgi:hypothetical protein
VAGSAEMTSVSRLRHRTPNGLRQSDFIDSKKGRAK